VPWKHRIALLQTPRRHAPAADRFGRRLGPALVTGVATLIAVLWGLFAWSACQQFTLAESAAESNTATLAKLVEAWALSTLERINYLAASVEVERGAGRRGADLDALLRRQRAADPRLFEVIDVIDRSGRRIATSDPGHPADSARNFDSDSAQTTPSLIGLPRMVRGQMLMPVLRPLGPRASGALGAVVVEIDPDYFGGFSADLGLPNGASVVLMRSDGPLLARNRPALGTVGQSYPDSPLSRALEKAPAGSFTAVETDGTRRVVSYRTNASFPLVVAIGFPTAEVYAEAWRRMLGNGAIGTVLTLVLSLAAWLMLRELRRRAAAEGAAAIAVAAVQSVGSGVAVLQTGGEHRIELANPAFDRLLQVAERNPAGEKLASIAGPEAPALLAACTRAEADGREITDEIALSRGDGDVLWLELRVAPIGDHTGLSRHAVMVMTDITERKRTADELMRSKEEAENASRAKSEFLANMSHELRTPLNAVIGFSDVIAAQLFGPVGNERYREYAELIRSSGRHLLEVISDILDLAKVEAKRVVLDEKPVDVGDLLAMCATLVASRAAEADVRVMVRAEPSLLPLRADELRVKQIVINLLSNAVKFSAAGSEVHVTAAQGDAGGIEIAVRDRGCGMTQDELALAVQPFRQVNSVIAKRAEGTGLGLPLAIRLTALHGGDLVIDSAPGVGTTAHVRFPPSRTVRIQAVA